jgi:hypothetical protein
MLHPSSKYGSKVDLDGDMGCFLQELCAKVDKLGRSVDKTWDTVDKLQNMVDTSPK